MSFILNYLSVTVKFNLSHLFCANQSDFVNSRSLTDFVWSLIENSLNEKSMILQIIRERYFGWLAVTCEPWFTDSDFREPVHRFNFLANL